MIYDKYICIYAKKTIHFYYFFALLIKVVKNHAVLNFTMFMLLILSIFLQYSEINYKIFGDLKYEVRYPLGRLLEIVPFCIIGLFIGKYQIIKKLEKHKIQSWVISVLLFILTKNVSFPVASNFGYAGLHVILRSIFFMFSFALLPIEKFFAYRPAAINIISCLTKYTLGIYCIHTLVGQYIDACMIRFDFQFSSITIKGLVIYAICYAFCFVIDKMPFRICKMLVN